MLFVGTHSAHHARHILTTACALGIGIDIDVINDATKYATEMEAKHFSTVTKSSLMNAVLEPGTHIANHYSDCMLTSSS